MYKLHIKYNDVFVLDRLRDCCIERLTNVIKKDDISKEEKRVTRELNLLSDTNELLLFKIMSDVRQQMQLKAYEFMYRGKMANLAVAYLLQLTSINPFSEVSYDGQKGYELSYELYFMHKGIPKYDINISSNRIRDFVSNITEQVQMYIGFNVDLEELVTPDGNIITVLHIFQNDEEIAMLTLFVNQAIDEICELIQVLNIDGEKLLFDGDFGWQIEMVGVDLYLNEYPYYDSDLTNALQTGIADLY